MPTPAIITVPRPPALRRRTRGDGVVALAARLALVVATSLLVGGLTSFAQLVLPELLRPFGNSAAGWTIVTAGIVALTRSRTAVAAVLGATSFAALVLGYQTASTLRGFPTSEELFLLAAVVVGPFVGVAASWLHLRDRRGAIACGLLAGIACGESAYGLTVISASTSPLAWIVIGLAGLALLATVTARSSALRLRLLAAGLTAAVATAFVLAYSALGSLSF